MIFLTSVYARDIIGQNGADYGLATLGHSQTN